MQLQLPVKDTIIGGLYYLQHRPGFRVLGMLCRYSRLLCRIDRPCMQERQLSTTCVRLSTCEPQYIYYIGQWWDFHIFSANHRPTQCAQQRRRGPTRRTILGVHWTSHQHVRLIIYSLRLNRPDRPKIDPNKLYKVYRLRDRLGPEPSFNSQHV